jgi:hypothetical protein
MVVAQLMRKSHYGVVHHGNFGRSTSGQGQLRRRPPRSPTVRFASIAGVLLRRREPPVGAKSCRSPTSGRFHRGPHRDRLLAIKHSLCVTGEDKVARFDLIVAGEAGFHERIVARRFAVLEVTETPAARCGVLF